MMVSNRCIAILGVIIFLAIVIYFLFNDKIKSFREINNFTDKEVDDFLNTFEQRNNKNFDPHVVANYYKVLHPLCCLGDITKMYVPPPIEPSKSVYKNQLLFEQKMVDKLKLDKNSVVLDMCCGMGKVMQNVHKLSGGCKVIGFNIEQNQISKGQQEIIKNKLDEKVAIKYHNVNDNLDMLNIEDNSFDAIYNIQAVTYIKDLNKTFGEAYSKLKTGGILFLNPFLLLPSYNPSDQKHKKYLYETVAVTGAVGTYRNSEVIDSLKSVGFKNIEEIDWGNSNKQSILIETAHSQFGNIKHVITLLGSCFILSSNTVKLIKRMRQGADEFIKGTDLNLFTINHVIVAVK